MTRHPTRVAITGMAISSTLGDTLEANIEGVFGGKPRFAEITQHSMKGASVRFAGEVPRLDVARLPDRKVQKIIRRKDVISLITTINAADHAGIRQGVTVDPERFGMYVGPGSTQIGDLTPYFPLVQSCADLDQGTFDSKRFGEELLGLVNPLVVLQNLMNNALCFGSLALDARGVNANFMDFHVSGLRAVGEAFRSLRAGRCDIAMAGGVSAPVEPFQMAEGVQAGYLARTCDEGVDPGAVVRPWDASRRGTIMGEGAVWFVMESEDHVTRRGGRVLGWVDGYGHASDGHFDFLREKESPGLERACRLALAESGVRGEDLGCIVGHGSGVGAMDLAEAVSYGRVFGDRAATLPIASPKPVVGEMTEAAGSLGVALAVESLRRGEVFPTVNFERLGDGMPRLAVSASSQRCAGTTAMVTARSFFGVAAALVVRAP